MSRTQPPLWKHKHKWCSKAFRHNRTKKRKVILYVSENNILNGTWHNKITFLPRKRSRRPRLASETGHLFAEASEVPDYDGIIHKTQSRRSYDQLTPTKQNWGQWRGEGLQSRRNFWNVESTNLVAPRCAKDTQKKKKFKKKGGGVR